MPSTDTKASHRTPAGRSLSKALSAQRWRVSGWTGGQWLRWGEQGGVGARCFGLGFQFSLTHFSSLSSLSPSFSCSPSPPSPQLLSFPSFLLKYLLKMIYLFLLLCALMFCLRVCLCGVVRSTGTGVIDSCKLPCGCCELNLGPMEEQPECSWAPSHRSLLVLDILTLLQNRVQFSGTSSLTLQKLLLQGLTCFCLYN